MKFANIEWQGSQPYSINFNDVYFNSENGLAETEYVFIEQNQLKERFSSLKSNSFTIIETGFGTGLNFYCAASHWLKLAPADAKLIYVGIEKFPLKAEDMERIAQLWPQLKCISTPLLQQYANLKPNLNQMSMAENRIQLAFWVGDILNTLSQITQKADAWFLDGFAPAKNAEMWSQEIFKHVARLSKANTTFATFTSAGDVRRGLQNNGFEVKKHAGFGKKREMLSGLFLENLVKENL